MKKCIFILVFILGLSLLFSEKLKKVEMLGEDSESATCSSINAEENNFEENYENDSDSDNNYENENEDENNYEEDYDIEENKDEIDSPGPNVK